ncbi:hypothetical protein VTN31DRAFT_7339 [Thermomyces dupontii]|uniref:uncharacterized protein n=1 Tax=Talaromyces thermophilus TaxID=28565 RepID=UPI0037447A4E
MSTASPVTPKGPRNPRHQQKRNHTTPSHINTKPALLSTPTSSPAPLTDEEGSHNSPRGKKHSSRSASAKKHPNSSRPPAPSHRNSSYHHRHTSSQPDVNTPPAKDSPHYAGPTFHASPAPSALPMPSFLSKSVPDSGVNGLDADSDSGEPGPELTPSKPRATGTPSDRNPEPSPLDFLFKAALEARERKSLQSPEIVKTTNTPNTEPKIRSRPESAANGIFPFEFDDQENRSLPIGPPFSTPYRDRMNALRASGSPQSPASLTDEERRAKAEQLKNLLLNPPPQRSESAPKPPDMAPRVPAPDGAAAAPCSPGHDTFVRSNSYGWSPGPGAPWP